MKLKALVTTLLFLAGVATSVAVAKGPPPGKGKDKNAPAASSSGSTSTSTSLLACKPKVAVVLKGDFVSGTGSGEGVFQMKVRQANRHGKEHVGETVVLAWDERTTFRRRGHAELEDFEAGDRLNVQARGCNAAKPKKPKKPKDGTTGSTSTATTTGTTTGASTGTGAGAGSAELLARRVVGQPAKGGSATGTTSTATAP